MVKIFKIFFFVGSWLMASGFWLSAFSQTVTPTYIGTTGNYSTAPFGSISSSVGEPMTTTTPLVGGIQLTQGFQQPQSCPTFNNTMPFGVSDDTICAGDSATICANLQFFTSGYTYNWLPAGQTTSCITVSPTTTTTYTLIVLISPTCGDTATQTITVSNPVATITGQNSICNGGSATLTASTSGGFSPYSYTWAPDGQLTQSIIVNPTATTSYVVLSMDNFSCNATASHIVTVNPTPTVTISPSSATICSGSNATLAAAGGITYLWSTSETTTTINPTTAGTYTVTGTDANGCSGSASAGVTINPPPTVSISPGSATICAGSTAILQASGGGIGNYSWSTGETATGVSSSSIVVNPTISTTYTVQYTNASGCTDTTSVTVNTTPAPTATPTATATGCTVNNGTASANASGGTSPYTYSWSDGQTTSTATGLAAANYTITLTDSQGCSTMNTVLVVVTSNTPTVSATSTPAGCTVSNGTATASVAGGTSPFTYSWNNGQTTSTATGLGAITYTITVTDSQGCSSTATVVVPPASNPSVTVSGNTSLCVGDVATLTANSSSAISYLWSTAQTTSAITAQATSAGTYTISVSVTDANGCIGTDTISVTVNSPPVVSVSSTYTIICTGILNNTTLTASSSGGSSYYWFPGGATTSSVVVQPPGSTTYYITVANTNGCTKEDSISISVINNPYDVPLVSPDAPSYCLGDSILPFTVTNPNGAVVWSDAMGGFLYLGNPYQPPQNLPVGTTNGWVTQGTLGCFADPSQTSVTIHDIPVIFAGENQTICPGFTVQLEATVSGDISGLWYEWFVNTWDSLIPNSNSAAISVNPTRDSTMYIAGAFNSYGCWDKDTLSVFIIRSVDCLVKCDKIYNGITPNGDGYNEEWWIDGIISFPENSVNIFNRWGTNVWGIAGYNNKDDKVWKGTNQQGQDLPDGTYYYIIEINTSDGTKTCSGWVEVTH